MKKKNKNLSSTMTFIEYSKPKLDYYIYIRDLIKFATFLIETDMMFIAKKHNIAEPSVKLSKLNFKSA